MGGPGACYLKLDFVLLREARFLARQELVAGLAVLGGVSAALAAAALLLSPVLAQVFISGTLLGLLFLLIFLAGMLFKQLLDLLRIRGRRLA
jgi:hypothetical protein